MRTGNFEISLPQTHTDVLNQEKKRMNAQYNARDDVDDSLFLFLVIIIQLTPFFRMSMYCCIELRYDLSQSHRL